MWPITFMLIVLYITLQVSLYLCNLPEEKMNVVSY